MDNGSRARGPATLTRMDLDINQPFARWRGLRAGLTRKDLDGPSFQHPFHGVLLSRDAVLTQRLRVVAALVPFFDSAHASHASAARVHGVPIPTLPDEHVTVVDPAHRLRRRGIRVHVRSAARVVVVEGVRVSALADCFVELASQLALVDLVVAGDWMVRRRATTPEQLVAAAAAAPGAAGRLARRAASLVRAEVDSPMETRLRLLVVLAGLPEPEVNVTIRDELGVVVRRYDLGWRGARLALEYDGRHHVEVVEQWEADLDRRDDIEHDDWRLITVVAKGIFADPHQTLRRVHRALRRSGLPGVPARLGDGWRAHFPGHQSAA